MPAASAIPTQETPPPAPPDDRPAGCRDTSCISYPFTGVFGGAWADRFSADFRSVTCRFTSVIFRAAASIDFARTRSIAFWNLASACGS